MRDLNIGEQVMIERRETAAEKTVATAEDLKIAASALRQVLVLRDEESLREIELDSGVEMGGFHRLASAAETIDGLAQREQGIADSLAQGADLIREYGLPD